MKCGAFVSPPSAVRVITPTNAHIVVAPLMTPLLHYTLLAESFIKQANRQNTSQLRKHPHQFVDVSEFPCVLLSCSALSSLGCHRIHTCELHHSFSPADFVDALAEVCECLQSALCELIWNELEGNRFSVKTLLTLLLTSF